MDNNKTGLKIKMALCNAERCGRPNTDPISDIPLFDRTSIKNFSLKTLSSDRDGSAIITDVTDEQTRTEEGITNDIEDREEDFDTETEENHVEKSRDFLSSYLFKLGSKSLLGPEGEKTLAKRIEKARKKFRKIVLRSPFAVREVTRLGERLKRGELRLEEVLTEGDDEHGAGVGQSLQEICTTIDRIARLDQKAKRLLSGSTGDQKRFERAQKTLRRIYDLLVGLHLNDAQIRHIAECLKGYAQRIGESETEISACKGFFGLSSRDWKPLSQQEHESPEQPESFLSRKGISLDSFKVLAPRRVNQPARQICLAKADFQTSINRLKRDVKRLYECESGIKAAEKEFIESNLRLVISLAKRYNKFGVPLPDLIQEGNIGLMHAVKRFDHRRGARFSTYAAWWIRQAIIRSLVNQTKTIRLPVHVVESINRLMRTTRELTRQHGRDPEIEEIATEMDLPAEKVRELWKLAEMPLSLETPIGEEQQSKLADFIEDETGISPERLAMERNWAKKVKTFLNALTPREEKIIRKRYGIGEEQDHTLEEIGRRMGVTKERVRQIEVKALKKLRRKFRSPDSASVVVKRLEL
jgi:RNA polymerase primary sigma factor